MSGPKKMAARKTSKEAVKAGLLEERDAIASDLVMKLDALARDIDKFENSDEARLVAGILFGLRVPVRKLGSHSAFNPAGARADWVDRLVKAIELLTPTWDTTARWWLAPQERARRFHEEEKVKALKESQEIAHAMSQ